VSGWTFVYDSEFAHVYDADTDERIDLNWNGARLTVETTGSVPLSPRGIAELRKLLQVIERRIAKGK